MIKLIILPIKYDIEEASAKMLSVDSFFSLPNDGDKSVMDQAEDFLMIHLCS